MTYRITGPRCNCGRPITPAESVVCLWCRGRGVPLLKSDEALLKDFEAGRLSEETWQDFHDWLTEQ